ncbi:lytic transglycosylase [Thalassotalea agarivorans]|nr:LysM peptidoglycan-binding domain-containing protein [Thalassotalea agarivorans]
MKYISVAVSAVIALTACQSTTDNASTANNTNQELDIASPSDINQALLKDETIDVIHPVADVEFSIPHDNVNVDYDAWRRIRDGLSFDVPQNRRVIAQRNWYAKHPSYLDRVAKRAEPFMFYILEELEANDMPLEIALLPIVESAFDPFAYSHGRASGMWQFVPATGERFGMKQNWWYDGRRDVIASTEGAIQYLKRLHKYFDGDWMLALAAYNSGEGRVMRAVKNNARKGKPTDFWSLDLPRETRAYVPKLLALADIVKRPADFDLTLYAIENEAVISKVDTGSQIDLAKAAQLADLTLAELQRLNPGFNRWATDPDGPHYLLLPNDRIERFKTGLDKLEPKDRLAWQRYKIKSGDTLGTIAQKFNTRVSLIQEINGISGHQIRAGKHLMIPVAARSADSYTFSQEQRLVKTQNRSRNGYKSTHIVKSGDNFWDISRKYKVNHRSLAKWNGMAPTDPLQIGQKLVVWQENPSTAKSHQPVENAVMRNIMYKVRRGDSLARIADKFNVSIKDIERWNNLNRKTYLQPGQMLKLSVDVTNNI